MPLCRQLRLLPFCLLLVIAANAPSRRLAAASPHANELLIPGVEREERLAVGESHTYRLEARAGRRWRVRVEQLGIDVELVAHWHGLDEPWRVDSPIDWDGTELLLLPEEAAGVVSLEVRRRGSRLIPADAVGPYRIRLDPVDGASADARPRLEVLAAMTAAGRAWAVGSGEGRRRALAHYRTAAGLWLRLRQPRLAAQSLYAGAVLHRLLGEVASALELTHQVLPQWRALADTGREADTLNEIGLLETAAGRHDDARQALGEALATQQRAGDLFRQVATSNNLCRTYNKQGLHPQARDCFNSALGRARAAGDDESEAVVLHNLGRIEQLLGQPGEALAHYRRALELHRAGGRHKRVAETLNSLAGLHRSVDEQEEALVLYLQALDIFRQVGAGRWEARTLHNLGDTYHSLGDPERAVVLYGRALGMRRELGDRAGEAVELRTLGRTHLARGRPAMARDLYARSLELEQAAGNQAGEGMAWNLLGEASAALGEPERARELFDQAIRRMRQLGTRPALARALCDKSESLLGLGRPEEAGELHEALDIYQTLGHRRGEIRALYLLAELRRATGQPDRALVLVEEALRGIESVQADFGDADLRATFASARRGAYELHIDLLMDRKAVREALEASERARAWGLLELLRQAARESVGADHPELAAALRDARRQLHTRAEQRRRVLAGQPSKRASAAVEAEYLVALADLERLEGEVRRMRPERADLARPRPPDVDEIRRLLDPATVLVEYFLGRDRGFVFLVTNDEVRAFELPPREQLEAAVRRLHQGLASPHDDIHEDERQAAELSRVLLAPVLAGLGGRVATVERMVVVADGALHYLPFAALPVPGPVGARPVPLVSRWEVVHLPSVSALASERRRRAGRMPAPLTAAVFADPVFDRHDPRLRGGGEPVASKPASIVVLRQAEVLRQTEDLELPRLRTSRREAEVIAALARAGGAASEQVLIALDFAADRALVQGARLARYRIVHFATHGVIDARYPALSGLVLSLVGEDGQPRDGFLRLRDIYGLELAADLVVLSACRTALGKEVRGEGLVGLTRGFLHAGASRVLASLWSVSDRATAELMERFYRGLFEDKLPPARALRRAQLSMLAQRRWRDPHNWAGFVLLGDWTTINPVAR